MSTPTPIWLDCDTGHDDAFAILLAAHHPNSNLLGISTVFGNAPLSKTTHNTRAILAAIGRPDIPVYAGAPKPFCREAYHSPEIHGESGLDGTTCLPVPTVPAKQDVSAVEAMYRALIATPRGTAWLVPTGALTNAALLFATHPDIVEHLAGVSIMGGAVGGGFTDAPMGTVAGLGERFGNVTPWAEFNIFIDPESARAVLGGKESAKKCTLIALDLTHLFLATDEVIQAMLHGFQPAEENGSAASTTTTDQTKTVTAKANGNYPTVRKLFVEILTFFAKTYADVFNITAGPPLHDPLAVAAAFAPALFDDCNGERFSVDVIIDWSTSSDSQIGRTKVEKLPSGAAGVRIPRNLDNDKLWRMLESCLSSAENAVRKAS